MIDAQFVKSLTPHVKRYVYKNRWQYPNYEKYVGIKYCQLVWQSYKVYDQENWIEYIP
jgi:hypothetical protein